MIVDDSLMSCYDYSCKRYKLNNESEEHGDEEAMGNSTDENSRR